MCVFAFALFADFLLLPAVLWHRASECATVRKVTARGETQPGAARSRQDDLRGAEHDRAHGVSHSDPHAELNTMPKSAGGVVQQAVVGLRAAALFYPFHLQILLVHEASKGSFSRVFDFEANDLSGEDGDARTSPFESRFPINVGITGYVATTGEVFISLRVCLLLQ